MFNRREFLATSGLVAWGLSAPRFLSRTAAAAPPGAKKPGAKDTILVVVELNGGNDGLNTIVPYTDDLYYQYRPNLKLAKNDLKKINDQVAFNPSMGGFASLLEDNALCVIQGVGYPNPDESHFRSQDIWHAGSLGKDLTEGWLGKALRHVPEGAVHLSREKTVNPLNTEASRRLSTMAFHLAGNNESSPLALAGAPVKVPSLAKLEDFQPRTAASSNADGREQQAVIESANAASGKPGLLDFVQRTAVNTFATSRRLKELAQGYEPKVPYPDTGLATKLKLAAQLIDGGVDARIFYVTIDGWDTHANQAATHGKLLAEVSDAMTAFFKDMCAKGHRDRLLMLTFSEFGRRAKENGSLGTDHGSAAPMFLVGGKVNPGVVGAHPSLTNLEMGNLKLHTDFRQVYAAVLEQWLGVPSKSVLGEAFKPLNVLRA